MSGCATPQFIAQSSNGVVVTPDGKMATMSLRGLAVNAVKIDTPYGLSDRIITFRISLINQTDQSIDFIPKQYLLFDQINRQYLALTKPDLTEAAERDGSPHGAMSWGFGMGTFHSRSMFGMHYYSAPFWYDDPFYPRRSYQGLLAKALPIHPITVFPRAIVDGNVYFAVPPSSVQSARLQITRLSRIPSDNTPAEEIAYQFEFTVLR